MEASNNHRFVSLFAKFDNRLFSSYRRIDLGNLSDPISEAIRMDAFFMEMLSYGFSYMVGMIFVMTYCCTSISEQKEINFKHSILIALLIGFCTVIIVEVLVRIFFGL